MPSLALYCCGFPLRQSGTWAGGERRSRAAEGGVSSQQWAEGRAVSIHKCRGRMIKTVNSGGFGGLETTLVYIVINLSIKNYLVLK